MSVKYKIKLSCNCIKSLAKMQTHYSSTFQFKFKGEIELKAPSKIHRIVYKYLQNNQDTKQDHHRSVVFISFVLK